MHALQSYFRRALAVLLGGIALFMLSSTAMAGGSAAKFVIADNQDSSFTTVGAWLSAANPAGNVTATFNSPAYGWDLRYIAGVGGAPTAFAIWEFGNIAIAQGPHAIDVYVPAISDVITANAQYDLQSAPWTLFGGCGTYATVTTFTFDQNNTANEGQFRRALSSVELNTGTCYRVRLSNGGSGTTIADAIRLERLFESKATIPDMPFAVTSFAAATTNITSNLSATPTIVTTLTITCPANGNVVVTASGESAAQASATSSFFGLAYSISRDSTATDNSNVVQSSALSGFAGDANRDFLNLQRFDTCTRGTSYTYRLTAYRAQPQTSAASFIWNGRLVAQFFP